MSFISQERESLFCLTEILSDSTLKRKKNNNSERIPQLKTYSSALAQITTFCS